MRNISVFLARGLKPFGASLITLGVIASCTQPLTPRCQVVVDPSTKDHLLELTRSTIEVTRKADGFHYTLEQHLERNSVIYHDCGRVYQVGFIPNGGVAGAERIEDKITYVLDKNTDRVIHKFTGAATFEIPKLSDFEERPEFEWEIL